MKLHTVKTFNYAWIFLLLIACSDEEDPNSGKTIWTGPTISFVKNADTDPTEEVNQDRITSNVWITRGNSGGEIYNAFSEENFTKGVSPLGTQWAEGDISNLDDLTFTSFRAAVGSPKQAVGKNLILYLEEDDIYLTVMFTSWGEGAGAGFAYDRSTED